MNSWVGIGNLGADPVLRETPSGKPVLNFTLAVDRRYWSGSGEERTVVKDTDWVPVVVWGSQATNCNKFLMKGSKVCIQGSLRPRQFTDKENVVHKTFEIVAKDIHFLDGIRSFVDPTPDLEAEVIQSMEEAKERLASS